MRRWIDGWHSPSLNRHMEIVVYGDYGFPLLFFPTAAADYLEYERFHIIETIRPFIEAGKVKAYSINSINNEAWMNSDVHPSHRAMRQVQYNSYIENEVVPYIWNDCNGRIGIITTGASLGAFHCANQLFRRPDLFAGMLAMSGGYDLTPYTDGYYDSNIYFNNPVDYLPQMNDDHFLTMLRHKEHIYIVTGQGAYENPEASKRLSGILASKGIPHELDLWGHDVRHDWPAWRDMMYYYLSQKF